MKSGWKILLIIAVLLIGLGVWFVNYAIDRDMQHFRDAKTVCERDCIQDSGGPQYCRALCAAHPNRYP